MTNNFYKILLLLLSALFIISCTSDDSTPTAPSTVGEYEGTNNFDKPVRITISNISGNALVTSYYIEYEYIEGAFPRPEISTSTISDGIEQLVNNRFRIAVSSNENDFIDGTVRGNTIEGTFSLITIISGNPEAVVGTYSAEKQ